MFVGMLMQYCRCGRKYERYKAHLAQLAANPAEVQAALAKLFPSTNPAATDDTDDFFDSQLQSSQSAEERAAAAEAKALKAQQAAAARERIAAAKAARESKAAEAAAVQNAAAASEKEAADTWSSGSSTTKPTKLRLGGPPKSKSGSKKLGAKRLGGTPSSSSGAAAAAAGAKKTMEVDWDNENAALPPAPAPASSGSTAHASISSASTGSSTPKQPKVDGRAGFGQVRMKVFHRMLSDVRTQLRFISWDLLHFTCSCHCLFQVASNAKAMGFGSVGRPQGKEYEPKAQNNDRFASRKHISSEDFNDSGGAVEKNDDYSMRLV